MTEPQPPTKAPPRGQASFCISRAAIDALLDAQATVYEICAYLVLAKHTDATGRYSSASISAINRYTGANKTKTGPVHRAIARLKTIHAKKVEKVSNGRSGRSHAWIEHATDLGPILVDRDTWCATPWYQANLRDTGEVLPDGPHERSKVLYVLPDFGEKPDERVWFGGNLVTGVGEFTRPLNALRHAGDVAARLLLSMYAANDMETWGGVRPVGDNPGPWTHYEPVAEDVPLHGGARLIRSKEGGPVARIAQRVSGGSTDDYFNALRALESVGLIYEVVLVLNRNAIKGEFAGGRKYSAIPDDAEPFYELDTRTQHGFKPKGEEGVGGVTANTAHALGYPVALEGGRFDGTWAAIVPRGYQAMIAGVYRLRFRVSNPKNAGVKGAWARIGLHNREAFELVQNIRAANKLDPVPAPWPVSKVEVSEPG